MDSDDLPRLMVLTVTRESEIWQVSWHWANNVRLTSANWQVSTCVFVCILDSAQSSLRNFISMVSNPNCPDNSATTVSLVGFFGSYISLIEAESPGVLVRDMASNCRADVPMNVLPAPSKQLLEIMSPQ